MICSKNYIAKNFGEAKQNAMAKAFVRVVETAEDFGFNGIAATAGGELMLAIVKYFDECERHTNG